MIIRIIKTIINMFFVNIKLFIIKIFNFKRFNFFPLNYISLKTSINLMKGGTIFISEKVKINSNSTISAINGGVLLKIGGVHSVIVVGSVINSELNQNSLAIQNRITNVNKFDFLGLVLGVKI